MGVVCCCCASSSAEDMLEEEEGSGEVTRARMPWTNCPKRCVRTCGAVLPSLLLLLLLPLRDRVARAEDEGRDAVARLTESMCASMAIWNRGQRSMLVPLMKPSTTGHLRRCSSKARCCVTRTHSRRPKQS